ncbi:macrolide export ATP-binding/permease protein MacB [bacterium BMS3Bbin03]|nr:macrolide export ATP-binding/permease protein MacB [bacterium BMS3Bbin03]
MKMTFRWFYIQEFFRDLKTQKNRAFLTAFAIAWGTLAVVLLLAFGEGFKIQTAKGLANAGNRIMIIYGGQTTKTYRGLPEGRNIRLTVTDEQLLKESLPEIGLISVQYGHWNAQLTTPKASVVTFLVGVEPSFETMRRMYPIKGSRFLNRPDMQNRRRVVFLGGEIAGELFGQENPVGKSLMINHIPFTVIGIMLKKLQTSMNNGPDSRRAVIPASTFRAIYGNRYVRQIVVRPRKMSDDVMLKKQIRTLLGQRHRFDPTDSNALWIWDFIKQEQTTHKIFVGIQIFLGLIGGLTLLVAGVGVANIMFVIVKERTHEIGIKKAVGARKSHILSQFIFESLLITALGGFAGLLFSWLFVKAMGLLPFDKPPLQYLGEPRLSLTTMLITVFILGTIGLLAGLLPARQAAQVNPVESLRYE